MVQPSDDPLRSLSQAARQALVPSVPPGVGGADAGDPHKERFSDLLNNHYPEIAAALSDQAESDRVVDGEIVAFAGPQTDFSLLQRRMQVSDPTLARRSRIAVFYYVFDIVPLDGFDLTDLALRDRKSLLRTSLSFGGPLRLTPHRNTAGEAYFAHACRSGWEGLVAKLADSRYVHRRSPHWLKFKCQQGQEFVIGGFTDPRSSRQGFAALLLGYYRGDDFVYAGKVGTGFEERTLRHQGRRLAALQIDRSAFTAGNPPRGARWVRPSLVGEVDSANGRRMAGSATPAFWAFGTTRRRETSSVRRPGRTALHG